MVHTLVIGVGGTGSRIVANFAKNLDVTENKAHLRTICIDTDHTTQEEIKDHVDYFVHLNSNIPGLQMDEIAEATPWYPYDRFETGSKGIHGVGRYRVSSCLLLREVYKNYDNTRMTIHSAITSLKQAIIGGDQDSGINIWMVASAGGGSGSGTFCDVARIVGDLFEDSGSDFIINAILTVPFGDIMMGSGTSAPGKLNSYALLKEIEYLNRSDGSGTIGQDEIKHRPANKGKLFTTVFLASLPAFTYKDAKEGKYIQNEKVIPSFLETVIHGSMTGQKAQNLADGNTHNLIEWTNFEAFADRCQELSEGSPENKDKGGRFYSFGISTLSMNVGLFKAYLDNYNVKKQKEKLVQERNPELDKERISLEDEINIKSLTTSSFDLYKGRILDKFDGNLIYQKKVFDSIINGINTELEHQYTEKAKFDSLNEVLNYGSEEAKQYIEENKKEWGKQEFWKEILEKKFLSETGKENILLAKENTKHGLKSLLLRSWFNFLSAELKKTEGHIKENDEKRETTDEDIRRFEHLKKECESVRNELDGEIDAIHKEISGLQIVVDNKRNEIERDCNVIGPIKRYPEIGVDEIVDANSFFDKIVSESGIDIDNPSLHDLIASIDGKNVSKIYAQRMAQRMERHVIGVSVHHQVRQYPFVMSIIAARDSDQIKNNMATLNSGLITGANPLYLTDKQKLSFPPAKWLCLQMVGGVPLNALKGFDKLERYFKNWSISDWKHYFCYPTVYDTLRGDVEEDFESAPNIDTTI